MIQTTASSHLAIAEGSLSTERPALGLGPGAPATSHETMDLDLVRVLSARLDSACQVFHAGSVPKRGCLKHGLTDMDSGRRSLKLRPQFRCRRKPPARLASLPTQKAGTSWVVVEAVAKLVLLVISAFNGGARGFAMWWSDAQSREAAEPGRAMCGIMKHGARVHGSKHGSFDKDSSTTEMCLKLESDV